MQLPADLSGAIVVVTGPPGAGKSTVIKRVIDLSDLGVLIDGDSFFQSVRRGWIAPWEKESAAQNETVTEALGAAAGAYARGGYVTAVDGIVGPWFIERFSAAANATTHYVIIRPTREVALARGTARPDPHLNDPIPIGKMHDEFSSIGVYERHVIDNSEQTVDETLALLIEALEDGRFRL